MRAMQASTLTCTISPEWKVLAFEDLQSHHHQGGRKGLSHGFYREGVLSSEQ
jgi:hypothetical protein